MNDGSLTVGYVRVSTKKQNIQMQIDDIKEKYPDAKIVDEGFCSGVVPAAERPEFSGLMKHGLRSGDTLVVWWIDRLGRDYYDVDNVIRDLLHRGVTIKTINQDMTFSYNSNEMLDMTTNIQISMITAMAAAERKTRLASAEAGRKVLRQDPKAWAEKFAGRKANEALHTKVLDLLRDGVSIRKTAMELDCGISTVQRVKRQNSHLFE